MSAVTGTKHPMLDADVVVMNEGARKRVKFSTLLENRDITAVHFAPGAFTPTCDQKHLKSLIAQRNELNTLAAQVLFVTKDNIHALESWKAKSIFCEGISAEQARSITMVSDCHGLVGKTIPGLLFDHPELGPNTHNRARMVFVTDDLKEDVAMEKQNGECTVTCGAETVTLIKKHANLDA